MEQAEQNKKEEPTIDIEVDEIVLKSWENQGLHRDIFSLVDKDYKQIIPPGKKFALSVDNFALTDLFIRKTEADFSLTQAKNVKDRLNEVREELGKVILNFAFKDMEFDYENRELVEENEDEKLFKINNPELLLGYNGNDWWIEHREEK